MFVHIYIYIYIFVKRTKKMTEKHGYHTVNDTKTSYEKNLLNNKH